MVYYSENQGAKYATKNIMPRSASLTQNMNIMHRKTQVSPVFDTHQLRSIEHKFRQFRCSFRTRKTRRRQRGGWHWHGRGTSGPWRFFISKAIGS